MHGNQEHVVQVCLQKTSAEIRDAVNRKVEQITAKIGEREARIAKVRGEYGIDDAALIRLLAEARKREKDQRGGYAATYSFSNAGGGGPHGAPQEEKVIGAGVVAMLLQEGDLIEDERATVRRLGLISRNVRPFVFFGREAPVTVDSFELSYDALEFLGF